MMKLLTRQGLLIEEQGETFFAEGTRDSGDSDSDDARVLRPLQTAACLHLIRYHGA